jgi:Leucine-rich repeat (LRR) protein
VVYALEDDGAMSENDKASLDSPSRRPWFRLHRSTVVLIAISVAVAVALVAPGEIGCFPDRHSYQHSNSRNDAVVHGWPLPFLWRTPFEFTDDPSTSANAKAWKFADSVRELSWLSLAVDIFVAFAAIAVFAVFVEWRRRKRSRFLQFTLRELLVCTTAAAILFAWWAHRRRTNAELEEHLSRISTKFWPTEPGFPLWVRNLAGDTALSKSGLVRPRDVQYLFWDSKRADDIQYVIERFPERTTLAINGPLTDDDVSRIASIAHLECLESQKLDPAARRRFAELIGKLPHLRSLAFNSGYSVAIEDDELLRITDLSNLESLEINNGSALTDRGMAALKTLKGLKALRVKTTQLTPYMMTVLAGLQSLRRLSLFSSTTTDGDFSALSQIKSLEELDLAGTNLDDESLRRLQPLRHLRYLGLCCAKLSFGCLKAMVAPTVEGERPFPNLRCVDLQGCDNFKLSIVSNLAGLERLDELRLSPRNIDSEGITALTMLPGVHRIHLFMDQDVSMPKLKARLEQALPNCRISVEP